MPTIERLTKKAVERLLAPDPSGRQTLYWDAEIKGFGVLVSGATTAKPYVVQHKLPGGLTRRLTVGATNVLDLEDKRGPVKLRDALCVGDGATVTVTLTVAA
jgi:hypothetical protein